MCANLDSVLVELMECLDKLEVLRRRFSEAVSEVVKRSLLQISSHFHTHALQGYFNLAKTRYSMGSLSVNALHYDKVMAATCLVEVEPSSLNTASGDETAEASGDETAEASGAVFRIFRSSTSTAVSGCLRDNR